MAESDSNPEDAGGGEETFGAALARGVCRALHHRGAATLTEFTLRSGRRADVIAVAGDGRVTIVEVKTSVADFRADGKWPEYRDYCDYFYFAVPEGFPRELLPDDCGIMVADPYDALVLWPAADPLAGVETVAVRLGGESIGDGPIDVENELLIPCQQ